jgi:CMP-N-acetylneuraminic acid synthetase
MNILAVIPARGGSKGIPRKNIRPLVDRPLIAWTIEAALMSTGIARVVVSTDDVELAQVARQWGAEVPFLRPPALAADDSPSIGALRHMVTELKTR